MRTAEIYSKKRLPIGAGLVSLERHIPARRAVKFAEHKLFAELTGNRRALHRRPVYIVFFGKHVNPGIVHIFVIAHARTRKARLNTERVLVQNVSRNHNAVFVAPIFARFGKVLRKQVVEHVYVFRRCLIVIAILFAPIYFGHAQFAPVLASVTCGQLRRVRSHAVAVFV